jgi:hypothetical protein
MVLQLCGHGGNCFLWSVIPPGFEHEEVQNSTHLWDRHASIRFSRIQHKMEKMEESWVAVAVSERKSI